MNSKNAAIIIILFFSLVLNISVSSLSSQLFAAEVPYTIVQKWQIGDGLSVPESILFDGTDNILYVSNINGLRPDGNGNFFISDWQGKTSLVMASGQIHTLLDTTASKVNSADLEYIISRKLLLIPTFFDNRIVAYQIK
ncbi:MAG: hypothetical protein C0403_13290 [Desulfobacterium sp.]|nr:hypothetical protein [Desulfobacterium sp.]